MTNFSNRLKSLRTEKKLTQDELATQLKLSKSAVSMYENGNRKPDFETLELIADFFNVDMNYLMGYKSKKHTPIYEAAAGNGIICDIPVEEINMSLEDNETVAYVRGHSMEPTLLDGDKAIVRLQDVPDYKNQICLVKVNGEENTFKRVDIKKDGITLIGDNIDVYSPHFYTAKEVEELPVQIMGVVVRLIRDVK